ncbi:MAG: hypothetical protein Q8Q09_00315 [Deltaproteobacteria bacterium]|nr:hypothetical protein [Deltaproteobacteria bacterium]
MGVRPPPAWQSQVLLVQVQSLLNARCTHGDPPLTWLTVLEVLRGETPSASIVGLWTVSQESQFYALRGGQSYVDWGNTEVHPPELNARYVITGEWLAPVTPQPVDPMAPTPFGPSTTAPEGVPVLRIADLPRVPYSEAAVQEIRDALARNPL